MKALLSITLAVVLSTHCQSTPDPKSIGELVSKIRQKLPKGWSASYEPEHTWLEVSRDEKVDAYSALPNSSPDEPAAAAEYCFAFRVGVKVSDDDYQRIRRRDQEISKELLVLYNQLVARHVSQKFDSFSPDNDIDRALVSRYNHLKKDRNVLPDFYFRNLSLTWGFGGPGGEVIAVADKQIGAECDAVRAGVINILSSYTNRPNKPAQTDGDKPPN